MYCIYTNFDIDHSSRFSFRASTHSHRRHTNKLTDASELPTHATAMCMATTCMGNSNFVVVVLDEVMPPSQELLNYISKFVHVEYVQVQCVSMDVDTGSSPCHLRLTNIGQRTVIGGGWSVYFNHAGYVEETPNADNVDVAVRNVDGWLYTLTLRPGLRLAPFSNITVPTEVQLLSRSYAFPRWYHICHHYYVSTLLLLLLLIVMLLFLSFCYYLRASPALQALLDVGYFHAHLYVA